MKHYIIALGVLLLTSFSILSCSNDDETIQVVNPLDGLTKLSEGYVIGAATKVEVWGTKNYFVGYNTLTIVLLDSTNLTNKITNAHVGLMPLMTMMDMAPLKATMRHACPVENPASEAVNSLFTGAVVFTMPSTMSGTWQLALSVHNHLNDKEGEASFNISVDQPSPSVQNVFTALTTDASKLILTLIQPTKPVVGMNDIEFTLHKKVDMMNFPADDSYTLEIEPTMPSMGHGSPNNVNPITIGNGHYKGKVNFTMTGEWQIEVTVKKENELVKDAVNFIVTL